VVSKKELFIIGRVPEIDFLYARALTFKVNARTYKWGARRFKLGA
jgi:hypothetical protein